MKEYESDNERASVQLEKAGTIFKLFIPSDYLTVDASEEHKETLRHFQTVLKEIVEGKRKSVILPSDVDQNGTRYFDLEVVEVTSE